MIYSNPYDNWVVSSPIYIYSLCNGFGRVMIQYHHPSSGPRNSCQGANVFPNLHPLPKQRPPTRSGLRKLTRLKTPGGRLFPDGKFPTKIATHPDITHPNQSPYIANYERNPGIPNHILNNLRKLGHFWAETPEKRGRKNLEWHSKWAKIE